MSLSRTAPSLRATAIDALFSGWIKCTTRSGPSGRSATAASLWVRFVHRSLHWGDECELGWSISREH